MDYRDFVRKHRESGAAITIAALPCDEKRASAFGLMKIDETGKVGARQQCVHMGCVRWWGGVLGWRLSGVRMGKPLCRPWF